MLDENQIYSIGPSGRVCIPPKRTAELLTICTALKHAVGEKATRKLWQYRMGATPYVALDIGGTAGHVSWTIVINGNLKFPTIDDICSHRDPISEVYDAVDAFYLVEALLKPFGFTSSKDWSDRGPVAPPVIPH